ncbi:MAG: hypothetical protein JKX99_09585 [Robiginitomaculum sp.]|nr:hypothetical protein [Robiginitomaculum sp.]
MKTGLSGFQYRVAVDGKTIAEHLGENSAAAMLSPEKFEFFYNNKIYNIVYGPVSTWGYGAHVYENDILVYRFKDRNFHKLGGFEKFFEKLDSVLERTNSEDNKKIQKELQPSFITDIVLGVIFFFVASQYDILAAAVSGACLAFSLYFIQQYFKVDLLGGLAKFGIAMSLLSVGISLMLQDEIFIQLKGTIIGAAGSILAFIDSHRGGHFIGKPMSRYLSSFVTLKPKHAAQALGVTGLVLVAIDLPLAFMLSKDQWIFYNAFLDMFIIIPVFIWTIWMARERPCDKN